MITDNGLVHFMRLAGLEHYAKQGEAENGITIQLGDADGTFQNILMLFDDVVFWCVFFSESF
jgi:hypothetical protein